MHRESGQKPKNYTNGASFEHNYKNEKEWEKLERSKHF